MRIIAGEFRGRRILPPESDVTRPITDRVKQSIFDILSPRLVDARVYDLFAGTGSMGLECLSRGAARVTFFERDRSALARLKKNVETLGVSASSTIVGTDLFKWFSTVPAGAEIAKATLVFLDPPYRMLRDDAEALQRLARQISDHHLSPDGMVVFRHDSSDSLELPPLRRLDERSYGGMTIDLLAPAEGSRSHPYHQPPSATNADMGQKRG